MLLNKISTDTDEVCWFKSSNILKSVFDKSTNNLTVIFKGGGTYTYKSVDESDYFRFVVGDSQGKILNEHIKKYPFDRGDKIDDTELTKEVSSLLDETVNSAGLSVVNDILDMINGSTTYNEEFLLKVSKRVTSGIEYLSNFR